MSPTQDEKQPIQCEALYPRKCENDAVCIYAGIVYCEKHAHQSKRWQLEDARQEYMQKVADIEKDFRAAMEAGIQPQDLEETPDDQDEL